MPTSKSQLYRGATLDSDYTSPMPTFRFIHAADIHLDSPLRGLSRYEGLPIEEIREASRSAFDKLIRFACSEKVDFVVIAGDLYDSDWKDMGTGLYFAKAMGRLGAAGIPVFLIRGNHDAVSVLTRSLPLPENVHVFSDRIAETKELDTLRVALHGRSFGSRREVDDITPSYPEPISGFFNIGILHTSLNGYAEHETYAPCNIAALEAKGYDYWALGHVHEHAILNTSPYVVFSGVLQGRHIREHGPKGAVLVEVEDGAVKRAEHIPLDVFRWATVAVDCTEVDQIEDLQGLIRRELRSHLDMLGTDPPVVIQLVLKGSTPLHARIMESSAQIRDDVRAIAVELSTDLWLEKLRIQVEAPKESAPNLQVGGLEELLASAVSDDLLSKQLQDELAPFLLAYPKPPNETEETAMLLARAGSWSELISLTSRTLQARLVSAED
ncbi:DNA repair exonuclease SbcCD nuclease subunit [Silvibacterium bohemicum]|uniref:DNA repair exonuclease SbcCD nuclease subunit n=1 Tax=Silvibacterium bohemicum TaxID=1577686 RepID=A0A841K084_9BACT|nr:DNA repair exonuclease [Silvibacterium bohemicum]MBB6146966.1 DNA repair exonuclease SbcCD nuclease subunit [Silvibacterium bohemicum]